MFSLFRRASGRRKAFAGNRKGSTAVEFALIAPPFLMLMMSTFEVGWFYFVNSTVDAAGVTASRIVRTGMAQEAGFDKELFFDEICPRLAAIADCDQRLTIEVQTYPTFEDLAAAVDDPVCTDGDPADIADIPYVPGMDNEIVRIRLCFIYNTLNPTIGVNVSDAANGRRKLYSTNVFRNEPFSRNN